MYSLNRVERGQGTVTKSTRSSTVKRDFLCTVYSLCGGSTLLYNMLCTLYNVQCSFWHVSQKIQPRIFSLDLLKWAENAQVKMTKLMFRRRNYIYLALDPGVWQSVLNNSPLKRQLRQGPFPASNPSWIRYAFDTPLIL